MKIEREFTAMIEELKGETPMTYASREKRMQPPARVEWFNGFCNIIVPYENEVAPDNRPLGSSIAADAQTKLSHAFEFDSKGLLQAVRRAATSPVRFVTLVERDGDTETAMTFRVDGEPKATKIARVWSKDGRVSVAARVSLDDSRALWTYQYTGDQLSSIRAVEGTASFPTEWSGDYHFEYSDDGQLDRIYCVPEGSAEFDCYKRNPRGSGKKTSQSAKKAPQPAKTPSDSVQEWREAFSVDLTSRVESVLKGFKPTGVVAVELVFSSSWRWGVPLLGVLLESEIEDLPEKDVWNPAEWENYESKALDLSTPKLEELSKVLQGAKLDKSLADTLADLCKSLTPRLKKVVKCGAFFACFPCDMSAPPRGNAVAGFFSKADQKVLKERGLV